MPYSCSTCNKTHNTGEICPEPIDDVVSHIKTAINNISKLPNTEYVIVAFKKILSSIEQNNTCKDDQHEKDACYGGWYCDKCGKILDKHELEASRKYMSLKESINNHN